VVATAAVVGAAVVPTLPFVAGAAFGWQHRFAPARTGALQHFAAGTVLAAIAVDLLPLLRHQSAIAMSAGILGGGASSLLLGQLGGGDEEEKIERTPALHFALLGTAAVDVFLDGVLAGVGASRHEVRLSLLLALGVENLPLGMTIAGHLRFRHPPGRQKVVALWLLAALLPLGTIVGAVAGTHLAGPGYVMLIAFGAAALLFLATEELLVHAHQSGEGPSGVALLFFGFWLVILLGDLLGG
jgi:ZIP family zinc transporter